MGNQRVPLKGLAALVEKFSAGVKVRAQQIAEQAGRPFVYVASGQASKEELARQVMERDQIREGLVCVLSCVEPCQSFLVRGDRQSKQLRLLARERKQVAQTSDVEVCGLCRT